MVLLWLTTVVACVDKSAEREHNARQVTASSPGDASAPISNEALAFDLAVPGAGWKMLGKVDAEALVPGAAAGAISPDSTVGIVRVGRADGDASAHATRLIAGLELDDKITNPTVVAPIGEHEGVRAGAVGKSAGVSLRFDALVVVRERVAYELIAWAPPADEADVRAFLDAFALRDGAVADASLAPKAVDAADEANVVGATFAVRGDKWRDFSHGMTLQAPPGWKLVAGRAATRVHPAASVALDKGDMRAALCLAPGGQRGLAHYHQEATQRMAELGRDTGTVSKGHMGDNDALITYGMRGDMPRARLATSLHEDLAVSLMVWSDGALPKEEVDAIANAVSFDPTMQAIEATTEAYRDHRFGFQFRPPNGWLRQDVTPEELAPLGTMVRWELDGRWIAIMAVSLTGNARSRGWTVSYLEQLMRDAIAPHALGAVSHEATVFAERPSVQIAWRSELQHVHALVFSSGGVAFAVISHDHGGDGLAHAKRELTLLP